MQSLHNMVKFEFFLELVKWEGWERLPQAPELGTPGLESHSRTEAS